MCQSLLNYATNHTTLSVQSSGQPGQLSQQDERHLQVDLDDEPIITAVHLVEGPVLAGPVEVKSEQVETQLLILQQTVSCEFQ